jgi:hypothetical protein
MKRGNAGEDVHLPKSWVVILPHLGLHELDRILVAVLDGGEAEAGSAPESEWTRSTAIARSAL